MSVHDVRRLLNRTTDVIGEIDRECSTVSDGVEHGLVNVKLEFSDRAYEELGKKMTEERLIAWLIWKKLTAAGCALDWEVPYPASPRKHCDLVLGLEGSCKLWLELKMAWKAWFNCSGPPVRSNSSFPGYLWGGHRSHSFRHDFEKLLNGDLPIGDYRAVCLVGADSVRAPMDEDVTAVVEDVRAQGMPWEPATERHWPDRRCSDFGINVWSWVLPPVPVTPPP